MDWLKQKFSGCRSNIPISSYSLLDLVIISVQKSDKEFKNILEKIQEHPDSLAAWTNLGSVKHAFGDYAGAEEIWLYATKLSPADSRSYLNLGDLYWNKLKDYPQAEWAYRSAIERDKSLVSAYRDLASLYRFSYVEKKADAFSVLEEGIENNAESAIELLALGGLWAMEDGNVDLAIAYYEEYIKLNPENAAAKKDLEELRLRAKNGS